MPKLIQKLQLARREYTRARYRYELLQRIVLNLTIRRIEKLKKKRIRNLKSKLIQLNLNFNECHCKGQDYSTQCLLHLCTCDLEKLYPSTKYQKYICNWHTNTIFKNKGCLRCSHSDCGKYGC